MDPCILRKVLCEKRVAEVEENAATNPIESTLSVKERKETTISCQVVNCNTVKYMRILTCTKRKVNPAGSTRPEASRPVPMDMPNGADKAKTATKPDSSVNEVNAASTSRDPSAIPSKNCSGGQYFGVVREYHYAGASVAHKFTMQT